jgi:hypothetical protein
VSPANDLSPGVKNGKRYGRRLGTALIGAEESHKLQATGYKERVESHRLQEDIFLIIFLINIQSKTCSLRLVA